jgi:hypothetical protein
MKSNLTILPLLVSLGICSATHAQQSPKMKMTTEIPAAITTPEKIETRLGTLEFPNGFPTEDTAAKLYEHLDFMHGVEAFLYALPGGSVHAAGRGIKSMGGDNQTALVMEELMDSKSLFLTPNTDTVYSMMWLDLKDGPLVIESPPNILGIVNDHWFRYVGDIGNAGQDRGKGGKYLLLPPDFKGEVPEGYFVLRSQTFKNLYFWRGFLDANGSTAPAVASTKKHAKVYPLAAKDNPPPMKFINVSGKEFNTIGGNDFSFFHDIHEILQEEPNEAFSPEILGMLAAIGIEKGKPFAPDEKLRKTLTEAVAVGNATARTIAFKPRMKEAYLYPGSAWFHPFVGGYQFLAQPGVRNLAARVLYSYNYTGVTPAMELAMVGIGSQYVMATSDTGGKPLDGAKTYKIKLPPNIPAKDFWSFVVYDNQSRSELQTDQQFPSIGSRNKDIVTNPDGSVDVWFGPTAPGGHEKNWVQTVPGRGWCVLFRLYGPEQAWFDKTWKIGEFELVQ